LDHGLEAAGFKTAVAVEMNPHCAKTLRHGKPSWSLLEGPVDNFSSRQILKAGGLKKGDAALLVGGPPCQPFSKSSYWINGDSKRMNDPRAATLTSYMRVLEETLPQAFLLENVAGMRYSGKDEGLQHLRALVNQVNERTGANYSFEWKVLSSADFGVPQQRQRFFLVGARDDVTFRFPSPRYSDEIDPEQDSLFPVEPYRTAWDAIGDLVGEKHTEDLSIRGHWGDLVPSIPEGENYLWHTDRKGGLPLFGWRTRYWSFLLKLSKTRPSWTIQATPGPSIGPFHWKSRRLSATEMCRIQTFPEGYKILGSRTEVQRQIGNAVPSLLTEVLGREIKTQLLGRRKSSVPLKLLPPKREPVPSRERVRKVSGIYLELQGEHEAHPGTGKGRQAVARKGKTGGASGKVHTS
jgi:DNA (cytosine-5)-methyltransferase 1